MSTAPAFSRFEFLIAWRYLRARRSEGGISVMTWISLIGIALAVAALIIVLAVRAGFRTEFVDTILGSGAHVTVYSQEINQVTGRIDRRLADYDALANHVRTVEGVTRAAPLIRGQVMANFRDRNSGVQVFGITLENLKTIPRIGQAETFQGNVDDFNSGIALGSALARDLGVGIGERVKLISPNGTKTAFGTAPRVQSYTVVYTFTAGRYDIDATRAYLPLEEAQSYFNREGFVDEIEVFIADPEAVDRFLPDLLNKLPPTNWVSTWKDTAGGFLRALQIEDNVMFVIMTVLVLVATMNIISGLVMLVKNKGRDIGILRTMGMSQGTILRVFFICGAGTGVIGTAIGVVLGVLFVINIDWIFSAVNAISGGGVWDPSIRGIYELPAELRLQDVIKSAAMSLAISFVITIFPARRAARMNPVEALRYE